jgi:hypothetical protein
MLPVPYRFKSEAILANWGESGLPPSVAATTYGALGEVFDDLKLVRCPRSLDPTLVTLPSMSLIPFAPFSRDDVENLGAICWTTRAVEKPRMSAFGSGHSIRQRIR